MRLLERLTGGNGETRFGLADYYNWLNDSYSVGGNQYLVQTAATWGKNELPGRDYAAYVEMAYRQNGIVFACIQARALLFSEARFQFQAFNKGRPGKLYGTDALAILENPWPNGTTGELLVRMEQDVSLAGNFYAVRQSDNTLKRLRPDWVQIVHASRSNSPNPDYMDEMDIELLGYQYTPRGPDASELGHFIQPRDMVHFSPIPDPVGSYRGMSWLTPVLTETDADSAATYHKLNFFKNGATVNQVVTFDPTVQKQQVEQFKQLMEEQHGGVANAYRTLYLGGGADMKAVGSTFQQIDFKVTQGAGEPLALDTPVPIPSGWSTMGALAVGDQVFGRDGLPATITGVSPVHLGRDCFRVTFNDRTSVVADRSHLWAVSDRQKSRVVETVTTGALRDAIDVWRGRNRAGNRFGVPPAEPIKLPAQDLLVDPYVLGAWLGDGQTAGAAICGAEEDLAFIASEIERRGYTVSRWKSQPGKVAVVGIPGGLLAALGALGVLGDKHIPSEYLRASLEQRLDLLCGLMDTDGTVGRIGQESCEFSSKYQRLATQVAELTRSLGYRATVSRKIERRSRTGETWRVTFRADPNLIPFLLPRKRERCRTPVWVKNRAIVSIEPVPSVPVRCIAVDSSDHLFMVGDGWVLTHNTRIAAAAAVPPVIAGFSEGLSAATYSNYGQARRKFADGWARPQWRTAAAALANVVAVPAGSRLWYDDSDIAFLKEDLKDAANIQRFESVTMNMLVQAGFEPDSVVESVLAGDWSLLKHTGGIPTALYPHGDPNAGPDNPNQDPNDINNESDPLSGGAGPNQTTSPRGVLNGR